MEKFESVDEVLDFAVKSEEEAHDYYNYLARLVEKPWMKDLFLGFAREELGHRKKLLAVKEGRALWPSADRVLDLKLAEYAEDVEAGPEITFQDALVVAMKREKKSFKLYTDLAAAALNEELGRAFQALAQEEARHKLRIELIYDDEVLSDN
ncbi:MAG: ferritin family protein [Thermodesulfobacteriota bacterium]